MGNWTVTDGVISQTKSLDLLVRQKFEASLSHSGSTQTLTGTNSIIGRAVIVHAAADDCTTQSTGNAGGRVAQCVIGVQIASSTSSLHHHTGLGNPATISATGNNGAGVTGSNPSLAVCDLTNSTGHQGAPNGRFYFSATPTGVSIIGSVNGITGTHGLHIHSVRNFIGLCASS